MIHADEIFMDQREAEATEEDINFIHQRQMEEQQQYEESAETLPVIDMNELNPSEFSQQIQLSDEKMEIVNGASLDIANKIIRSILDGHVKPLDFIVRKKLLVDTLDIVSKNPQIKSMCVDEIERGGKSGVSVLGAKLSVTNRKAYQYNQDKKWSSLKESIAPVVEQIKEQEKKVQAAVKNNCDLVDSDTGELIASVVPAPETTSISVSFKKK
jgi:hypothetical protein